MRQTLLGFLAIGCLMAAGCSRNHYQIRVTPTDSGFDRTLTCWTVVSGDPPHSQALDAGELARIEESYGSKPEPGDEGKNSFRSKFGVEMPQDVGGAGRLERIETSLGTLWLYVERFRGSDDLEAELNRRRKAVDTVTDLTLGWLRSELGDQATFEQLEAFVDNQVRNDLKNLTVYSWRLQEESENGAVLERLWLYLRERDYLTLQDTVSIVRAFHTDDPARVLDIIARLAARKLTIDADSEALAIFRDPKRLSRSFEEHVRNSEFYAKTLKTWREQHKDSEGGEPPEPAKAIGDLLLGAFIVFELGADGALEVTLDAECEPFSTNGKWNEETRTVTWNASLDSGTSPPIVCAATWAVPNEHEQGKRFGRTRLRGEKLAEYAMWCDSLSEKEAEQWDRVLSGCNAGESWTETVKSFQFAEKTPARELLADQVKRLLIEVEVQEK